MSVDEVPGVAGGVTMASVNDILSITTDVWYTIKYRLQNNNIYYDMGIFNIPYCIVMY